MEQYEQLSLDLNNNNLVIQDNALISSSYDMTAMEQKLLLILISTIKKNDTCVKQTVFKVTDIAKVLEVTPEALYRDLPKICKSIMTKVIEIKKPSGDWEMFNLITYAKYKSRTGSISLEINKQAEPYLLQLKDFFTAFKLVNPLQLDSKYAIRIYQLSKGSLYRKEVTYELSEFKKILKLDKKAYDRFNNITLKVLKPSLEEINTKTDLRVSYDLIMQARKVVGIKFFVDKKATNEIAITKETSINKKHLKFTDYEQRTYDYDDLERKLLGWDKAE